MVSSIRQEPPLNSVLSPVSRDQEKITSEVGILSAPDRMLVVASYCLIGIGLLFILTSTASFGAGIFGFPSICSSIAIGDAMFPLGISSLLSASRLLHPAPGSYGTSMNPGISYELKFGPLALKL